MNENKQFLVDLVGEMTLSKLIEAIREGEEWSKGDIARQLGISKSYYSDFLSGEKIPTMKKAAEWANVLGYSEARFIELAVNDKLRSLGLRVKLQAS